MTGPPEVGVRFTAEDDQVNRAVSALVAQLRELRTEERANQASARGLERSLKRLARRAIAVVGGFEAMRRGTRFILRTARDFEQLEQRLISLTGSELEAAEALQLITDFAKKTPFEVQNIVDGFAALSAVDISPTRDQLTGLGNFAAAQTRSIEELISAIVKAGAGNSRELQKFGVVAQADGNKLKVLFRGVTHEIDRDFQSVLDLFVELGETEFGDAMERQMLTAGGAASNLDDTVSLLAKEIGDRGLNAEVGKLIRTLDAGIGSSEGLADAIGGPLIAAVRTAGSALGFLIEHGEGAVVVLQTLGGVALGRGLAGLVTRIIATATASGGLTAALLGLAGGPVTAVIALAAAIAVPLIFQLRKANGEADDLIGTIRRFRTEQSATDAISLVSDLVKANGLIDEAKVKLRDLDSQRRVVPIGLQGTRGTKSVQDPGAKAEEEKLQIELDALEESRARLLLQLQRVGLANIAAGEARATALTEEQRKAIAKLVDGLRAERDELQLTKRELLEKQLIEAGAGPTTRSYALDLFDQAEALREVGADAKLAREQLARLPEVREALLQAQGNTGEALRLQLQREYQDLIGVLLSQADFAGVQLVQKLINVRLAREELNRLGSEFSQSQQDLRVELERIELERSAGAITSIDAQEGIRLAYERQIETLQRLLPSLEAAAAATGDPAAIARVRELENELLRLGLTVDRLGASADEFGQSAARALQSGLSSFLQEAVTDAENLGDAFEGLASSIVGSLQRVAAEMLATLLVKELFRGLGFAIPGFASGGEVEGFATGGYVRGPGGPTSDRVPAMLSPGEFVIRAAVVKRLGVEQLKAINEGMASPPVYRYGRQMLADGGLVAAAGKSAPVRAGSGAPGGSSSSETFSPQFNLNAQSFDAAGIRRLYDELRPVWMRDMVEFFESSSIARSIVAGRS